MGVYVDPLVMCPRSKRWPWPESCHLLADTPKELHAFAARIGLRHSWYQGLPHHSIPHYDLTAGVRARAVAAGAVELKTHAALGAAIGKAKADGRARAAIGKTRAGGRRRRKGGRRGR